MDTLRKIADLVRDPTVTIDFTGFAFAMVMSLLVAFVLSITYRVFYESRATGSQIHRCFILLGPSVTAIFIAIQYSLPLSLGLLGALSIIRFRTPIKEPEEVGFIMLLVACSVVVATFQLMLLAALILIVIVGLAVRLWLAPSLGESRRSDGILVVSIAGGENSNPLRIVRDGMGEDLPSAKLESISEVEGVTNLQYSFRSLSEPALAIIKKRFESISEVRSLNVYFNGTNSIV